MGETVVPPVDSREPLDEATIDFAQGIADQVESFLIALREIARGEVGGGRAFGAFTRTTGNADVLWWAPGDATGQSEILSYDLNSL